MSDDFLDDLVAPVGGEAEGSPQSHLVKLNVLVVSPKLPSVELDKIYGGKLPPMPETPFEDDDDWPQEHDQ